MSHETLTLVTSGLLRKYGFNDGDEPDQVDDVLEAANIDLAAGDWHSILRRLVREHVLPVLDQRVEVEEIETIHNPIRAITVDGVNVEECWYGRQPKPTLTPETVDIPMADVLRVCAEHLRERRSA